MAQAGKGTCRQATSLTLIPGTQKMKEENQLCQVVLNLHTSDKKGTNVIFMPNPPTQMHSCTHI